MNYLIIGVMSLAGLWHSVDGLYINFLFSNMRTLEVSEIETGTDIYDRYLEVQNGVATDGFVYETVNGKVTSVYSGLMSAERSLSNNPVLAVVVKDSVDESEGINRIGGDEKLLKWYETHKGGEVTVKGITKVGFSSLGSEEKRYLEQLGYTLADNFVYVNNGEHPRSVWINLLILMFSILGMMAFVFGVLSLFGIIKDDEN